MSKKSKRVARPRGANLTYVTTLGARTRRHKYFRDARNFALPVLVGAFVEVVIYLALVLRTARSDWENIALVCVGLCLVPLFSAFTLTAFRRHQSPILAAFAVTAVFFSFAVSILSAMRVPVSYMGLAAALPAAMAVMAFGNIRFHTIVSGRVAMLPFKGMDRIVKLLGNRVSVLESVDADLSEFETLLIDPSKHHDQTWSELLARCYLGGVDIMPWTRFMELYLGRVDVASFKISQIIYAPGQLVYARLKRFLDLLAVVVTLPVTLPLSAAVALYLFLLDGWPVIFVQHRRGFGGKIFRIYKFRTMYRGKKRGATRKGDRRIMPGCRTLRRFRLDELPQLFNIAIGDMSLIGPRPEAIDLVKWYEREMPEYAYRLLVLPGLTGWAQVRGGYTSNPDEARVKLSFDLYYIKHLSFDLDAQILVRTIRTVLFGSGAR